MTRTEAQAMTWDELEALDTCECGTALATHPALVRAAPAAKRKRTPAQAAHADRIKDRNVRTRATRPLPR